MKKLNFGLVAILCSGFVLMTSCHSKKEMVQTIPVAPVSQSDDSDADNQVVEVDETVMATPITMEVTETVNDQMKKQQEELINGWEIVDVQTTPNDTLISVELVPDANNLQSIKLGLNDEVLFNIGSATLSPKAKTLLAKLADNLNNFPETNASVIGYTSNTGSGQLNMDLAMSRAQNVMDFLVAKGVSPTRLKAISKGWNDPVASNATAAGRAKNRRVEIWVSPNEQMIKNAQ
ncbi:MAG: OmpA family protein [Bacteroidales bacterium]